MSDRRNAPRSRLPDPARRRVPRRFAPPRFAPPNAAAACGQWHRGDRVPPRDTPWAVASSCRSRFPRPPPRLGWNAADRRFRRCAAQSAAPPRNADRRDSPAVAAASRRSDPGFVEVPGGRLAPHRPANVPTPDGHWRNALQATAPDQGHPQALANQRVLADRRHAPRRNRYSNAVSSASSTSFGRSLSMACPQPGRRTTFAPALSATSRPAFAGVI